MSLPHTTSKKAESGNDRAGNWIYNTKKEWISNKVDWSTSAINGSHIWLDAEAHGCHIQDCKKTGSRKKCASCKVLVHEKCIDQLERINSCKCRPTFVEGSAPKVPYPQHHVAHRRKQEGKCDKCGKYFQSKLSFQTTKDMISVICSWCKKAVHNKPECSKDMYMDEKCTLGLHHNLIVPPSWIVKLPPRKYSTAQGSRQRRATRRRSSRERRAFLIKPIPGSEDKVPVIVFVNPKSGGNQGSKIMEKFQWLLNPRQVFDLMSDGGPHFGLELYRKVPNLRILVCGGDGSVGWVLSEIDRMKLNPTPPVAVLPLGTGNDLSRFLGWGSGYTDEPLSRVLTQIEGGVVEKFDRWNLDVRINSQVERSDEGQNKLPLSVMNNYFSLGADADVCLEFHESREANPDKFTSRLRNLMFYGKAGGRQVLQSKFKDLHKCIDRLLCDGVDLTERIHEIKPICILFLNISKYSAGTSPWGHPTGETFLPQSSDDGYLEVIGFTFTSMVANQCGGHGVRIYQCSQAVLCTNKSITMQVDGEPCRLNPSQIHIKRRNQAKMIFKKRHQSLYTHHEESEIISSGRRTLKINYLTFQQYEKLVLYDVDELKSIAEHIYSVANVDFEKPLSDFRSRIEELRTSEEQIQSKLSGPWCFLDATWPTRIYRIDEGQENLMLIGDIIEDGIHVLDLARKESASDDAFQMTPCRGSAAWRESNSINLYRNRPSPLRRVSSPTLYEFDSLKDAMYRTGENFEESDVSKRHSDIEESSDGSQNDFSHSDVDDDHDCDDDDDDDGADDDDLESDFSPRIVPLSPGLPYTKHNGMTFNSAKSISTVDKETMKKMLLQAARKGDIEEFTALHLAEASLIWCDSRGYTSLHLAAKYGRKNIVKYIISNVQKCVLDLVDNERGQTPLHKASYYQRRTICNMLVNAGASLTRLDLEGNTPRLLALQSNDGELAKYLENQERLQIIASDDHETAV